ncbi:MAG: nucleotidyltransferase domain-containing protein [Desulfurococcales archaeon]|nr:nucleotidyltransferase domain-containing protein [Desulfurococcales archaeon]
MYAEELRQALGRATVILYGSYARGDFNVWSDVDVIIVSEAFEGRRFLQRQALIPDPPEGLEGLSPIPWTPGEARVMLRKPAWRKALKNAIVVIDDYSIGGLVWG